MKYITLCCSVFLFLCLQLQAQEKIKISRTDAEAIFLQNNLQLISEKLNVENQKAAVIQAKLWPNPTFSVSEINFWATDRQTGGQEVSPPFLGNFGKNRQVAFEIQQLVQTAGKRKKLISLAQVDVAKAEQYFEDLLNALKLELRSQLTNLQYIQQAKKVQQSLFQQIETLTNAYKKQLNIGNISKAEYTRLKAQQLTINKEILALDSEFNEIQKELKLLLRIADTATIEITNDGFVKDTKAYETLAIDKILANAQENRPDYKLALLAEKYGNNLLAYEKAQRVPNLNLGINYDRNGSTMLDFVGFGVSFDLPVFNRNKGNIKKAQLQIEDAKLQQQKTVLTIQNEIVSNYKSLQQAIAFRKSIDTEYEKDLDLLLENYTKNFKAKNVSMLEYLDFIAAYLDNKKIILGAQKDINHKVEELNYALGKEPIN